MAQQSVEFWDNIFSEANNGQMYSPLSDPVLSSANQHFGDLRGKKLLDIGSGDGQASLFFAQQGAEVTAIDLSQVAVDRLNRLVAEHGLHNLHAQRAAAEDIASLGRFDHVFGSMILHHIEPFADFARDLRQAVAPGGTAFFFENSAASRILIWFRSHVVGRFGVAKFGDPEESPLEPREIDALRRHFTVDIEYPELLFFQLASVYLLKYRAKRTCKRIDEILYRFPAMRRMSYRQILYLR